jgi:hypothetical protein
MLICLLINNSKILKNGKSKTLLIRYVHMYVGNTVQLGKYLLLNMYMCIK